MRRKVVYIAGPFRGANAWEIECNIRRAEALALEAWRAGAACICPHTNTRFFQGAAPDDVFLDGDLEILRRCDAILLTEDWEKSSGARKEREEAIGLGLKIFHCVEHLREWLHLEAVETEMNEKPYECEDCGRDRSCIYCRPDLQGDRSC